MTLSDLRRLSVKQNLRITFPLSNGMECVLNEHGVAQVPALRAVPAFSLEEECAAASLFTVESVGLSEKEKAKAVPRRYTRDEITAMATAGAGNAAVQETHDE